MKKIPFCIRKLLFVLTLLASGLVFAQEFPSLDAPPPPPPGLPIDGGVLLLLISGALFGISNLWNREK